MLIAYKPLMQSTSSTTATNFIACLFVTPACIANAILPFIDDRYFSCHISIIFHLEVNSLIWLFSCIYVQQALIELSIKCLAMY